MQQQTSPNKKVSTNAFEKNLKVKSEIPLSFFSFLFSEMVQYLLSKRSDEKDFDIEEKLSHMGYPIGEKLLELSSWREKNFKRDLKIIPILQFIHNNLWKMLFNKNADGLEKSTEDQDEYRIIEISPLVNKYVSFIKGSNTMNCASFFGGIIEGFLNSADFRCKVSTHFQEIEKVLKTYYIIKFDADIIQRDSELK